MMTRAVKTAVAALLGGTVALAAPVTAATSHPVTSQPGGNSIMATCPTATAPGTLAAWSDAWANVSGGWVVGDGGWSIKHPTDGSYLFDFGDTAIIRGDGTRGMPHGTAVSWRGNKLTKVSGDESWIPDTGDTRGSVYWPGPMFLDGGRLFAFGSHLVPKDGGWDDLGQDLAEFSWPACQSPSFKGMWTTPSTGRPSKTLTPEGPQYNIAWNAGAVAAGNFLYIYGSLTQDGWFGKRIYVARVPSGNVTNLSKWQYWNSQTWVTGNEGSAAPVVSEFGGPEGSFQVYYEGTQFKFIAKADGAFGTNAQRWTSLNPTGPWTFTHLTDVPWVQWDQTYLAAAHPTLPRIGGKMLLSYSHQRGCWPNAANTACDATHAAPTFADFWDHPEIFRNVWRLVPA
jgi:hypothetical protein